MGRCGWSNSAGRFLVSEPSARPGDFVPGYHLPYGHPLPEEEGKTHSFALVPRACTEGAVLPFTGIRRCEF